MKNPMSEHKSSIVFFGILLVIFVISLCSGCTPITWEDSHQEMMSNLPKDVKSAYELSDSSSYVKALVVNDDVFLIKEVKSESTGYYQNEVKYKYAVVKDTTIILIISLIINMIIATVVFVEWLLDD